MYRVTAITFAGKRPASRVPKTALRKRPDCGRQTGDQSQLFYLFNLERRIPVGNLLRRINPVVTRILAELRDKLAALYSDIGRPSSSRL